MFLSIRTLVAVTLTCFSLSANAARTTALEAGQYTLTSGEKGLCRNFSVSESDLGSKRLSLGGFYDFEVGNSSHAVESDLDPACEFREQNRVQDRGTETVLVRVNEEYCKGALRSKTVSEATLRAGEIQIRHQVDGAEIICVWNK